MNDFHPSPPSGRISPSSIPSDGAPMTASHTGPAPMVGRLGGAGGSAADGAFGSDDDLGALGLVTPATVTADARERFAAWRQTVQRVVAVEGPRGIAIRWSVAFRYLTYLAVIGLCAALVHHSFAGTAWESSSTLLLFSASLQAMTAALGCAFMPQDRPEIVQDFRHFLFQIALLPATAIAMFDWVLRAYMSDPRNNDNFLGLMANSLPIIFAFTLFTPAIIFVKAVAGRRTLSRTQQDDAEMMQTWTRQDPYL